MSEQAPERRSSGGFSFSQKIGPLPAYGWILAAAGAGLAYIWWRNRHAASTSSAAPDTSSAIQPTGIDYAPQIATVQSEVQDLQSGASQQAGFNQEQEKDINQLQKQRDRDRDRDRKPDRDSKRPTPTPRRRPPPRKPAPRHSGSAAR